MERLDNSVSCLKSHISKSKSKQKATCEETVSQVASYLVFLVLPELVACNGI